MGLRPPDRLNRNYSYVFCRFRVIASYMYVSKVASYNLPHLHLTPSLGVTPFELCPGIRHLHRVSKKRPTFTTCYNFYIHSSIATIFGTNVADKVGN